MIGVANYDTFYRAKVTENGNEGIFLTQGFLRLLILKMIIRKVLDASTVIFGTFKMITLPVDRLTISRLRFVTLGVLRSLILKMIMKKIRNAFNGNLWYFKSKQTGTIRSWLSSTNWAQQLFWSTISINVYQILFSRKIQLWQMPSSNCLFKF